MRVLLNGVGRIGKAILRIALEKQSFEIIAINELNQNLENIAYSINYDSTYGRLNDKFEVSGSSIKNTQTEIKILNYSSLNEIDYDSLDIDIVIDASGAKVDMNTLKSLSPKLFFLTHPNKNVDINIILGVNETNIDINMHKVISTSSCNATALLPILKLIDDNYEIKCGDIATIHPLLNHQKTLDSQCVGSTNREVDCSFEFGRSSTQNIIPSKTTTIDACSFVKSNINHDLLSSNSFRVPTSVVGAINVTLFTSKKINKDSFIKLCKDYKDRQLYKIIYNNFDPLVSGDFQKCEYTTIIDHRYTQVINNNMIKLVLWYDNEWGYASKVVDIVSMRLSK
jgi:glyceraldehyde 3-phosphate dehydrogenase